MPPPSTNRRHLPARWAASPVVFDSGPPFRATPTVTLPRPAAGSDDTGAFSVFVDQQCGAIARNLKGPWTGKPAPPELLGTSEHCLLSLAGSLWTCGESHSPGYRESKGQQDAYRIRVRAVAVQLVADRASIAGAIPDVWAPADLSSDVLAGSSGETVDLEVCAEVFAMPSNEVAEGFAASSVLPLARSQHLSSAAVVWGDEAVPALSLYDALCAKAGLGRAELIVLRANPTERALALRVDCTAALRWRSSS